MKLAMIIASALLGIGSAARAQVPICVIDGTVSDCSKVQTMEPERIESIEIVKGAAAQRLYGDRATYGVIVIQLRKGAASPSPAGRDPFAELLFPPELVMANQQAIGLSDAQRAAIQAATSEAQAGFVELQFAVGREMERLQQLLGTARVDQAAVLEQVDRVLAAERQVKRAQLGLMVRIKNQLTPEQQARLRELRR